MKFWTVTGRDFSRVIKLHKEGKTPNLVARQIREKLMTNTYRARYINPDKIPVVMDVEAANPVSALNRIHHILQFVKKFEPNEYRLTGLSLFHNANASGQPLMVESPYDLPKGPNPNLKPVAEKPAEETPAMVFFTETEGQGRLAE